MEQAIIQDVTPGDIPAVKVFLERHVETSIFLLSCLVEHGPTMGESPMSGNYRAIVNGRGIAGVFCLTRKGDLLAQTGGRTDLSEEILRACSRDAVAVSGVISEWQVAESLWQRLISEPSFRSVYECKSVVYERRAPVGVLPIDPGVSTRALTAADFDIWDHLDRAFHAEEGLSVLSDDGRRRRMFAARAADGKWWGAFEGGELVSMACLNAAYGSIGQVGGVFTRADRRRRGLARLVTVELIRHQNERRGIDKAVLFAAETNRAARAMYEALDFSVCGRFGLLFGGRN
jgi:predicted GNAT family acetyltransferase